MPESETCVICQEDFCESKRHKTGLHCGHVFHKTCVREWLKSHSSCPMCRGFTVNKITRTLSGIYYIDKLTHITTESVKLFWEQDNDKRVEICKNILKIYIENPYIFVNNREIGEGLKKMMITINDIIIKGFDGNTQNLDSLNETLIQAKCMLDHIY
jgi:hypothetical protein